MIDAIVSGGSARRRPCAGAIVFDEHRRVLLIRRGKAPSAGRWSLPGGRCDAGERPDAACVREVDEETALAVQVVRWVGRVERDAPDGGVYVIDDYLCRLAPGQRAGDARAGDDAADVRWATRADLDALPLAPGVLSALDAWAMLPG